MRSAAALLVSAVSADSRCSRWRRDADLGGSALLVGEHAGDEGGDEQDGDAGEGDGAAGGSDGPARRARSASSSRSLAAAATEASRNAASWSVRSGERRRPPLERGFEPCAAVQLAGRGGRGFPAFRGGGEVAQDALPGGILVEPRPQPWPRPGEGFVGQLDGVLLGGHQPGPDQQPEDVVAVAVTTERPGGHPANAPVHHRTTARRGAASPSAAWDAARRAGSRTAGQPSGRRHRGSHRWPDTPRRSAHGRRGAATSRPGRVRASGRRPGFAFTVAHQQVDQAGFESQPGCAAGPSIA